MARLDRLAAVKDVAQLGAVLGREFPYTLLRAVAPLDEGALQQALARLVEAELFYQRGLPPQATYLFKHALIQDTAYQSLLKSTRQQYHQRIAQVLVAQFPEIVETQPELVAQHYTEAGLSGQALPYWQRAGQRALQRSANAEAVNHLTRGLEVLKTLPDSSERAQQELLLQTTLGPALNATCGIASPEVEQTYVRARELCRALEATPQVFPVLTSLCELYTVRAQFHTALESGQQFLALARGVSDPLPLVGAHAWLGISLYHIGAFTTAHEHLQQGMQLYKPQHYGAEAALYGADLGVACYAHAAWALWFMGYAEQALLRIREALGLAQQLRHPFSQAYALTFAAEVHHHRGEVALSQAHAEAAVTLATEQGFPHWVAQGTMLLGWARAMQGRTAEGIATLQQGMASWRDTGAAVAWPHWLALLAEAYGRAGQVEEGLRAVTQALATIERHGETRWEADLYRLQGDLLLQSEARSPSLPHCSAEESFLHAVGIARRQQARSWELRAAMSLARLWQRQSKRAEARQLLAEVYAWFTEGFDTADLQEARALLAQLPAE